MCGRFSIDSTIEVMGKRFTAAPMLHPLTAEGLIFPTMLAPMVINSEQLSVGRQLVSACWGISIEKKNQAIINARAETITQKKLFSEAFACRRGIVPATSFFEWESLGQKNIQYEFSLPHQEIFGLAVIYTKLPAEIGQCAGPFAIITVPSVNPVRTIHPRMPLILDKTMEELWLSKEKLTTEDFSRCQMQSPISSMLRTEPMPHLFEIE